ncbi:MAG: hypothetical protein JOZ69_17530 [Myxococcales bacterium]|nr:hypothetical protein [Myxococcales bacterium]
MKAKLIRTAFPLTVALFLAAGAALAGGPSTPLGTWMKGNMVDAKNNQDFPALVKNFNTLAGKPPASGDYGQWSAIAKAGSAAAAKSDMDGVKTACTKCHDTYKAKYKKDFPTTPFP